MSYFQIAGFIEDARSLLKGVELFGIRAISQPQFHLQAFIALRNSDLRPGGVT
jgi:hypothetical protein